MTFTSVLIKHCDVVPDMVDRWHHLALLSLEFTYSNSVLCSLGEIDVN